MTTPREPIEELAAADLAKFNSDYAALVANAEAAANPVVTELVHKHEQRQDQNEIRKIGREEADDALHYAH